ncbi:MAG: hypothetical protein ACP5M4_05225 [Acidobacteriaceae bacterium]
MRALALAVGLTTITALAAIPMRARQSPAQPQQQAAPASHPESPAENGDHIPPDRAEDSYAIYSLLMPGKLFEHMGAASASRWAIAEKTITFDEMNPRIDPRGALKPPPGNEIAFHQAVQDFEQSREISYTLQSRLHLDHPYDLLNPAQVRELRHVRTAAAPDSRQRSRYAAYPGVTFFSAVYFSKDRHAALVYVNDWCGVLCAQGQWVYLEKTNGGWQRQSGITVPGA